MSNLYLITGPSGVGKSTISKKIAQTLKKSVLLEGDEFYHHVVGGYVSAWKDGNHLDVFWRVCIDTINNYLNAGYDVVFNYIISKECFERLKGCFDDICTKFVVLMVNEETLMFRDKQRPIDCQMNERCIILLNNFENYNYDDKYVYYIDNVGVDDIVDEILKNDRFIIDN